MKKIIVFVLLLLVSVRSFSQSITSLAPSVKTYYLEKCKSQKKTAWLLIGGGASLMLTGALIPNGEYISSGNFWNDLFGAGHYENEKIQSAFGIAGFFSMLGSIPFFVASRKNKKNAMSLSFKNETMPVVQHSSFASQPVPSITYKINL